MDEIGCVRECCIVSFVLAGGRGWEGCFLWCDWMAREMLKFDFEEKKRRAKRI